MRSTSCYDPQVGRFLQTDPIGYQDQQNLYAYVHNDPVNATDPTGMCSIIGMGSGPCQKQWHADQMAMRSDPAIVAMNKAAAEADALLGGAILGGASLVVPGPEDVILATGILGRFGGPLGRAIEKVVCCFVAGTLVETEDGLRPIEEIEEGDLVWARNTETVETALKEVTDLIPRHERVIWEVSLSGEDGEAEFFETTDDHPWWIVDEDGPSGDGGPTDGRWVTTDDLVPGMVVVSRDADGPDGRMVIDSVTETDRTDATYNLTVADFHTYFVGEQRVLVHNCDVTKISDATGPRSRRNTNTNASEAEVRETLTNSGFTEKTSKDGTASTFSDGSGRTMTIRDSSSSPSGRAMDVRQDGEQINKVNLDSIKDEN